jgi:hypothetical protein
MHAISRAGGDLVMTMSLHSLGSDRVYFATGKGTQCHERGSGSRGGSAPSD